MNLRIRTRTSTLPLLALLLLLAGCGGGEIVTVRTLTEKEPSVKVNDVGLQAGRSDQPVEEMRLSEELQGVTRINVHQYLQTHRDSEDSMASYQLGTKDLVQVDFFDAPDLSSKLEVLPDGSINLPLAGKVRVAGLTTEQVAANVSKLMRERRILNNPEVSVNLLEIKSRKVKVFGAIGRAGQYFLRPEQRLLDVVAEAGGVDFSKDSTQIFVMRKVDQHSKLAIEINLNDLIQGKDPNSNILLADEDIIYIPRAKRYMIMGEVKTPGIFTLDSYRRTSILEAIIQAGGFSPIAAKNKVWIYRVSDNTRKEIRVRVGDLMKGGQSATVYLEENDMIIVPESLF
jgi:polysaccharide biosynthesis/export protein